ncbi:MAG: type I 3-dehydroquinate dehydratase [Clostridiales bacterium]|nr:type I 3-dehydroquinate dehydratase [Clostridiales bacterium]
MREVILKDLKIGSGIPKICVPVTGKTEEEILLQAKEAAEQRPDLLEWRADFYEDVHSPDKVKKVCKGLGDILGQIPLIFTVRTENEGGSCRISTEGYVNILRNAAKNREIDVIDVEIFMDFPVMAAFIRELQNLGKKVIASNHHFHETPKRDVMQTILEKMEEAGADIRKLAVMPSDAEDVLELLAATLSANRSGEAPVITMSMGSLGAVSRVSGQVFGSCVTFGTVGAASAPGQIEIENLRSILKKLQP